MRDELCDMILSPKAGSDYKKLKMCLESELARVGGDRWRMDEYQALAKRYFYPAEYILKGFKCLFDFYFIEDGMYIHARREHLEKYSDIVRYVHPYLFIAAHLAESLKSGGELDFVVAVADNTLENGLEHRHDLEFAENHCHLSGAFDGNITLLEMLAGREWFKEETLSQACKSGWHGTMGKDIALGRWAFQTVSRYMMRAACRTKSEPYGDGANKQAIHSLKRLIQDAAPTMDGDSLDGLSVKDIARIFNDGSMHAKLINHFARQFDHGHYDSALLLFLTALFLKAKEQGHSKNFSMTSDLMAVSIFLMQLNILRSEMVMGEGHGLKAFTNVFHSPYRKIIRGTSGAFVRPLFMSGVTHAALRKGSLPEEKDVEAALMEIDRTLKFRHQGQYMQDFLYNGHTRLHPYQNTLRFAFGYHFGKNGETYRKQANGAKKMVNLIMDFFRNESNNFSLKNCHKLIECAKCSVPDAIRSLHFDMRVALTTLDAAGDENKVPPEVFAPVARELRESTKRLFRRDRHGIMKRTHGIRFAFHAGEDFSHIVTGMRRIHETIDFLHYERDDRLGHALAIGLKPRDWMQQKREVLLPFEEHFDNCLWLYQMSIVLSTKATGLPYMVDFYRQKMKKLVEIAEGSCSGSSTSIGSSATSDETHGFLDDYQKAYSARRFLWEENYNILEEWKQLTPVVRSICSKYVDRHSKKKDVSIKPEIWDRLVVITIDDGVDIGESQDGIFYNEKVTDMEMDFWEAVQDEMLDLCSRKGIILEANPSSNVAISDIRNYSEHPIFRWRPVDDHELVAEECYNRWGIRNGSVVVCVNSDDPGIFTTTLQNEFRLILKAASAKYPEEKARLWLDDIRKRGVEIFNANYVCPFN